MHPEVQVVGPTIVLVLGLSGTHPHRSHRRDAVSMSCGLACLVPTNGSGKCSRAMGLSELADLYIAPEDDSGQGDGGRRRSRGRRRESERPWVRGYKEMSDWPMRSMKEEADYNDFFGGRHGIDIEVVGV